MKEYLKKIFIITIFLYSTYGYSKSIIYLKILNKPDKDSVELRDYLKDIFRYKDNSIIEPIVINNSEFKYVLENKNYKIVSLVYLSDWRYYNDIITISPEIFIMPNDSLYIEFDFKDISNTIFFKGKTSKENKFLYDFYNCFYEKTDAKHKVLMNLDYKNFVNNIDSLKLLREKYFIKNYNNNNKDFLNFMNAKINYTIVLKYSNYKDYHNNGFNVFNNNKDSSDYYNRYKSYYTIINKFFISPTYLCAMSLIFNDKYDNYINNTKDEDEMYFFKKEYRKFKFKNALYLFDFILAYNIAQGRFSNDVVDYYESLFPNSEYLKYARNRWNKINVKAHPSHF